MRLYGTLQELSSLTIRLASGKTVQIQAAEPTASAVVLTLPDVVDGADEFVMKDTAVTMTNKTLTIPTITTGILQLTRKLVVPEVGQNGTPSNLTTLTKAELVYDTGLLKYSNGDGLNPIELITKTGIQDISSKTISSSSFLSGSISNSSISGGTVADITRLHLGSLTNATGNGWVLYLDSNRDVIGEAVLAKVRGGAGADMTNVVFPSTGTLVTDAAELTSLKVASSAPASLASGLLTPSANNAVIQRLTSAGAIDMIANPVAGRQFTLINATGSDITINNDTGATAANRIVTGTGAAFTFKDGTALTALYDGSSSRWRLSGGAGGAGGGTTDVVTQALHGFAVGDVLWIDPLDDSYKKAQANAANTAEVVGVVSKVVSDGVFELTLSGEVAGLTGLTSGEVYFLSAATAGALTITEPSVVGQVSLPVGIASSATSMYVAPKRGVVVGSANVRTTISLSNGLTTTVQNVSAYDAGELSGWVVITNTTAANTKRFYVQAQFSKKGDATGYNCSFQTQGDTPPAGFTMDVTTAGAVHTLVATLPSVSGFNGASINFALNAPAVGATLPLQIDGSLVNGPVLGSTTGVAPAAGRVGERIRATGTNIIANGNSVRGVGTLSIPSAGVWLLSCNCYAVWSGATGGASHQLSSVSATVNTFPEIGGASGGINDITTSTASVGNATVVTFPNMVAVFSGAGTVYLNVYTVNAVSATSTIWGITAVRIA